MSVQGITGLRSVDLGVPHLETNEKFYTEVWGLAPVARTTGSVYFRGTHGYHHILGLHARPAVDLLRVDLTAASRTDVDALHGALDAAGVPEIEAPAAIAEPGGGYGFTFKDPDGRAIRIIADGIMHADAAERRDRPIKITHTVFNSPDVARIEQFYCRLLGFRVSDRTKMMTFVRCNRDHHNIAFAHSTASTLHHIAFVMTDYDSVMRGAGRMRDNGYPIEWGVGRHGPGNNVFAYFIAPDDVVVEYTAEVEKVGDDYKVRGPEDWTWPPGRMDQWGIAVGPTPRLREAHLRVLPAPGLFHAQD